MEIGDRIRYLRKSLLSLSQEEFGDSLGVSRDVIGNIECDRLKRPDQKEPLYRLICQTFDVNENWLKTGNGEPFITQDEDDKVFSAFGEIMAGNDPLKKRLLSALLLLNESDWKRIKEIAEYLKNEDEQ